MYQTIRSGMRILAALKRWMGCSSVPCSKYSITMTGFFSTWPTPSPDFLSSSYRFQYSGSVWMTCSALCILMSQCISF